MKYQKVKIEKDVTSDVTVKTSQLINLIEDNNIVIRKTGFLQEKAFFLPAVWAGDEVDWIIVRDDFNCICLVPLKV